MYKSKLTDSKILFLACKSFLDPLKLAKLSNKRFDNK